MYKTLLYRTVYSILLIFFFSELPHAQNEILYSTKNRSPLTVPEAVNQYGSNYFTRNESQILQIIQNRPVTEDYILGSGDGLSIKFTGVTNQTYREHINFNGSITFGNIPTFSLSGLTLQEAREKIREIVAEEYKNVFVDIDVFEIKKISVVANGYVRNPGAYVVPGNSNLIELIYLCGGPTVNGSFRTIEFHRNGKEHSLIDLYDYFISGKGSHIRLQDGDQIIVPEVKETATIYGEVNSPARYEYQDTAVLRNVLELAGGNTPNAYMDRIQLSRKTDIGEYEYIELSFSQNQNFSIQDGDIIKIPTRMEIIREENIVVNIDGQVQHPGSYYLPKGTTLKELIEAAGGLRNNGFLDGVVLTRNALKNDEQMIRNNVFQHVERQLLQLQTTLAENAILSEDQKLLLKAQDYRKNIMNNLGTTMIPGRLLFDPEQENPELHDQDRITIPPIPETVLVAGAVYNPGSLIYHSNWSVDDYLNHVGGVTEIGAKDKIYIMKPYGYVLPKHSQTVQIEKGDIIVIPPQIEMSLGNLNQ